ncbi:hypothetical protein C8T65DRAFT_628788 [Cerioporus squamosus]|nr:hypothetical protein C8T65DRAFT_628788 [Cerioporus squamosus]
MLLCTHWPWPCYCSQAKHLQRFRESFYPPAWLSNHAEVTSRDIHLVYALKPAQVYSTHPPTFAVKITVATSEEASVYDKLLRLDLASRDHILPSIVVQSDTPRPFVIMPCLTNLMTADISTWDFASLVCNFRQMVEAVEMLHSQRIAHMDVAINNFVEALEYHIPLHDCVELGKIYIIDFGVSHCFDLGPAGRQPSTELPPTQVPKPQGITRLDPFSWDVYCLGCTFQTLLKWVYYRDRPQPWILRRYATWLVGNEQGCTAVCRCRPGVREALWMIAFIGWIFDAAGALNPVGDSLDARACSIYRATGPTFHF